MADILTVSIDLNKIDKTKIQTHDKNGNPFKNGAKYYNLQIFVNDDMDHYGNNVGVCDTQTKEQRENKEKRNYLGNGKRTWTNAAKTGTAYVPPVEEKKLVVDDLPF